MSLFIRGQRTANFVAGHAVYFLRELRDVAAQPPLGDVHGMRLPFAVGLSKGVLLVVFEQDERLAVLHGGFLGGNDERRPGFATAGRTCPAAFAGLVMVFSSHESRSPKSGVIAELNYLFGGGNGFPGG